MATLRSLSLLWILLLPCSAVLAQTGSVTGTVTDGETGESLPGVNVVIVGTTQGSSTDIEGRYEIQAVEPGTYAVQASFVGYETQERADVVVEAGEATEVDFVLSPGIALQEVVVVGYGEQRRRDLTGSVASVSGESIAEMSTPSVAQAIQGKVAGVQVTPASGEPGEGAIVRIRGVGTLNDASPLYVVDGMLLDDINFLNPNDIESVEVLKDASATAIYGSRGANGVIIISTKKGTVDQGTRFSFNTYAGTQSVMNPINLTNAQEYAMLANELAQNEGFDRPFENPDAVSGGTDWQDEVFQSAPIQSYQLSATGGTETVSYYLSANLIDQAGVVPKSDFRRLTVRLNNDYDMVDWVRVGHNINFSYTEGNRAPGVFRSLYVADPTISPRNEDGEFSNASVRSTGGNPAAAVFYTRNEENGYRLAGNFFGEADFLENFTFRSSFGIDYDRDSYRGFSPVFEVSPVQKNETSSLRIERGEDTSWLWENTLNYNYLSETGDHRLTALAGITAQSFYSENLGGARTNLVGEGENLWFFNAGDAEGQSNFNSASNWKMLSYLFRTNYALLDRYLVTASLRIDGSSRFGEENRYGYFPSFALGWNLAEEAFLRGSDVISAFKLRGSWGKIGNDKIGSYPGIPVVTGNLNAVFGSGESLNFGASPIELANPDVQWEETMQINMGADMAFFDDVLQATLDYYRRNTEGILVRVPIPRYVGVGQEPFVNAAEVLNSGIEGTLSWNGSMGAVRLDLGINGSTLYNEVQSLGGGREEILGGGLGNEISTFTRTAPGQPIGYFWGYETAGIYQTEAEAQGAPPVGGRNPAPGDLIYVDQNDDGIINSEDRVFLGSGIPDFIYGFNVNLGYEGLDLSLSFSGQSGNEIVNGKKAVRFGVENFEASYLDRWHGPGTSNTEPRVTNAGYNYQASDRFIEDGSFLKLQTATLGYRLPQSLLGRLDVQGARIYVSGTNLFTITGYSGYTPEITENNVLRNGIDLGVFPIARTITAGINLTL